MNPETPVHGGAVDAEEDPVRNWRPSRVLRVTIKTHLKTKSKGNKKTEIHQQTARSRSDLKNIKPKTKIKREKKKTPQRNSLKTNLILGLGLELPEHSILVGDAVGSHKIKGRVKFSERRWWGLTEDGDRPPLGKCQKYKRNRKLLFRVLCVLRKCFIYWEHIPQIALKHFRYSPNPGHPCASLEWVVRCFLWEVSDVNAPLHYTCARFVALPPARPFWTSDAANPLHGFFFFWQKNIKLKEIVN